MPPTHADATDAASNLSTTARGVLEAILPAAVAPARPAHVVLAIPGTSYHLHLVPVGGPEAVTTPVGKRISGTIEGSARRVDRPAAGGRFVEPVIGRPRRVQGTVIATSAAAGTITVNAGGAAIPGVPTGLPITAKLTDARQKPDDFAIGSLVCFDMPDGATFRQG